MPRGTTVVRKAAAAVLDASATALSSLSETIKPSRVIYWFRTDLRLSDSPALHRALSLPNIQAFYPVWCWDPSYIYGHRVGPNRFQFLLESMSDISTHLTAINPKQKLHVVRGPPEKVLPRMWKSWGITHIVWERDSTGYARDRDGRVRELAREAGVEVIDIAGRHLYDPEEVVKKHGGKPTMTLHSWQLVANKMGDIARPLPTPLTLPDPGDTTLDVEPSDEAFNWPGHDLNSHHRTGTDTCFHHLLGPNGDFAVPTLSEMGFAPATTTIKGGTTQAHDRLDLFLSNPLKVATFSKPNSSPTALEPSTTLLSPYIKFGCVSVREIWWGCKDVISSWDGKGGKETKEPENMFGQLQFRDMYACAEVGESHFERIRGNSVCKYIDWGLQNQYDGDGKEILPRPPGDPVDEERFLAWKEGRTGFPWIDACMRQLKKEGWMHHLARHSTACFLTRGQCYISWERGMEVYDELLVDWDPASNPGNWMWLSCSAFFSQYFRVYGLTSWPMKTDKTGQLVRKYCPELKGFPDKYIYSPHLAPESVQKAANCIIGVDYPLPMLDEQAEKQRCISRIKNAYSINFHGNSPEVMDGSAENILRDKHIETGALKVEVKSEQEVKRERGEKKRVREGNGNLDSFVNTKRKAVVQGEE